jgi:hypothetical protein
MCSTASERLGMPNSVCVEVHKWRKVFNPSPIGLALIISDRERVAMARKRDELYNWMADATGSYVR